MSKPFKHIIHGMQIKGNCFACKYLEYIEAEDHDPSGFCCNKREYKSEREEKEHLNLLNYKDERYLRRQKKCCEIDKENYA